MRKNWILGSLLLFVTSSAVAQTPMSAVGICAPANPSYLIRVGDHPGHAYGLAQGTCTWSEPWEIAGLKNTQGVGTQLQEVTGNTTKIRGTFVDDMANGDKAFYSFEFTLLTTAAVPQVKDHKWELLGGTGKLQGVKGRGTCTAAAVGSTGDFRYECRGEHTLAK